MAKSITNTKTSSESIGSLDLFFHDNFFATSAESFSKGNDALFYNGGAFLGTFEAETVNQLSGSASMKYTQVAGSLSDWIASKTIDMDKKQRGNEAEINLYFTYDGADADLEVVLYDLTNLAVITGTTLLNKINPGRFRTTFTIPANCLQIKYGFQVKVENIGSILIFDDIEMSNKITGADGSGGGGTSIEVNQATHGLSALEGIYHDGTDWVKAQADDAGTLAQFVVTEIVDVNNFVAYQFGEVEITAHGKSVGDYYFLSNTILGGTATSEPSTGFSSPLFYVIDVDTIIINVYRPHGIDTIESSMDSLSDVNAPSPTNGNILTYNSSTGDWENSNAVTVNATDIGTNATDITDLETLSGVAGATNNGTFTGNVIPDNVSTKPALQSLETSINTNDVEITNLQTLSGSPGATNHGTFTGITIPDNLGTKASLQSLETSLEARPNDNLLINGDFRVNQRGLLPKTLVQNVTHYIDRWRTIINNGTMQATVSLQTGSQPSALLGVKSLRTTATITGQGGLGTDTRIEEYLLYAGKTLTLGTWMKSTNSNAYIKMYDGIGGSASAYHSGGGGWEFLTVTYTVANNPSYLKVEVAIGTGIAITNGQFIEFTGIKLEEGSIATRFVPRHLAEELRLCKRYYQKSPRLWAQALTAFGGSTIYCLWQYDVEMRNNTPTIALLDTTPYTEFPIWNLAQVGVASNLTIHGVDSKELAFNINGFSLASYLNLMGFLLQNVIEVDNEID